MSRLLPWPLKLAKDPFVGRFAFFRAYSGRLDAGSYMLNNRSGKKGTYFSYLPNAF